MLGIPAAALLASLAYTCVAWRGKLGGCKQRQQERHRMNAHQNNEPFFITEEIAAEMVAAGYVFEPPAHGSTLRPRDVLATLYDDELAAWPGEVAKEEVERRRRSLSPNS